MKSVFQHIRESLESKIRPICQSRPSLEELRLTEWSPQFETLQRNRLVLGAIRYATMNEKRGSIHGFDLLGSVRARLDSYDRDGNQEHLVDSANLLMIEFECPTNSLAHFSPVDDGVHVSRNIQ